MRGISKEAADAFINGRNFKKSNTVVKDNAMYLFGNKIAWKENGFTFFSLCGWDTRTTCDRLSALGIYITHRDSIPYYNREPMFINQVYIKENSGSIEWVF